MPTEIFDTKNKSPPAPGFSKRLIREKCGPNVVALRKMSAMRAAQAELLTADDSPLWAVRLLREWDNV